MWIRNTLDPGPAGGAEGSAAVDRLLPGADARPDGHDGGGRGSGGGYRPAAHSAWTGTIYYIP